jgi:hypothetical protein
MGGGSSAGSGLVQGVGAGSALGPWGSAIGGAVGLIGGIESGNKASEYQQQQQEALAADQAKRDAYVAQQQALYQPTQQKLLEESANPTPLNYGQNLGQINQQTQQAEQKENALMAAHGMTGSGLQGAGMQSLEMGRVGELSSAFNTGLNARTSLGLDLLQRYNPLLNAQFGEGALPQQMKFGAEQQETYNKGMEQGMTGFGQGLAGVMNMFPKTSGQTQVGGANPFGTGGGNPQSQEQDMMAATVAQGNGISPGLQLQPQSPAMPQDWDMSQSGQQPMAQTPAESQDLNGLNAFNMGF